MSGVFDESLWLTSILFVVALFCCSLFAFIETSVTAIRLFKIDELERTLGLYHDFFRALRSQHHRVLTTILLANCCANVVATVLSDHLVRQLLGRFELSGSFAISLLSIVITTVAILTFGEVIPKNLAKAFGSSLLHSTLWITNGAYYLLSPLVTFFAAISDKVVHFVARRRAVEGEDDRVSVDEMQFLIKYTSQQGIIPPLQAHMLERVFDLSKSPVIDVMVPRAQVIALSPTETYEDAVHAFMNSSSQYLPVAEGGTGELLGYVSARDMLAYSQQEGALLGSYLHHAPVIMSDHMVSDVFDVLRAAHSPIAFVQDRDGSIIGLVAGHDILALMITPLGYTAATAARRRTMNCAFTMSMREVHDAAAVPLPAGMGDLLLEHFLAARLNKPVERGDTVRYAGYTFVVVNELDCDTILILPTAQTATTPELTISPSLTP